MTEKLDHKLDERDLEFIECVAKLNDENKTKILNVMKLMHNGMSAREAMRKSDFTKRMIANILN